MLVRSAGRRQRRCTSRALAASFAQLQLPWLAPAQLRWAASQTSPAPSASPRPRRRSRSTTAPNSTGQLRELATAADQYSIGYEKQLPPTSYGSMFRGASQDRYTPWDISPGRGDLSQPSKGPIVINTTTISPSLSYRICQGVSGTARDLLAHFHTNLSIGRTDRAAAILQRLGEQDELDEVELSNAHTAYLQEVFKSLTMYAEKSTGSQPAFRDLQKWFESEIRNKDVLLTSGMLVVMIRAAIRELNGALRERAVRRYAEIAKSSGHDTMDDVLFSPNYSDEEFTIVGRVTSDFFEPEEEVDEVSATGQSDLRVEPDPEVIQDYPAPDLAGLPGVRPTPQKGLGLSSIQQTVGTLVDLPQLAPDASAEARRDHVFAKQQRLERASVDAALERWRKADEELRRLGINTVMQNKSISALMWQWYQALLATLEKELAETREFLQAETRYESDRHFYGPYLEMISMPQAAATMILQAMSKVAQGKDHNTNKYESDIKLASLTLGVAKALEQDCQAEASRRKTDSAAALRLSGRARQRRPLAQGKKTRARSKSTQTTQDSEDHVDWPTAVRVKLGAMLVSKLIETAQLPVTRTHPRTGESVTQMQPAFLHRATWRLGRKVGVIAPNPALTEKLQSEPVGSLMAKLMPMVVEPKPWKGWQDGGYLHYKNPILRLPIGDRSGRDYFKAADRKGDLERVYAGLNALGKVPWMVNPDVFRVQLEAWNSGEPIANFAPLSPNIDTPPEPDSTADSHEKREWFSEVKEIENRKMGLHSKRCFQNFQLEVARSFIDETMYFPHSLDFRGRAYPIPPYLNHMGADNVRGLCTFAHGKPLGPNGLRWLKIHLATVAGHDKASLDERVKFTDSHLDDIYDSVRSPLEGRRWWLRSDDAWQTLAACFELTKALDSPDPAQFVSHLPIQQDGTCNGLQHYAALGGDKVGAAQVNLEPGDRPADVYTAVADAVKREIRQDAAQGNEIARKLDGHITRKCVKQPVMTNVYGVTYYGARLQVKRQLEAIFPHVKRSEAVNLDHMSRYVADKIFKSLGSMFSGAQAIQTWLGQCADRITTCLTLEQIEEYIHKGAPEKRGKRKAGEGLADLEKPKSASYVKDAMFPVKSLFKSSVVWTTPLGLPVVQPYRRVRSNNITTRMQSMALQEPQVWDPVSRRKQLQAFPPNFIHSLDSTHMLLSATKCDELGLTFASIHDSFWTHACDVDTMGTVLRDAFVSMHSEDIIGRLREEFQARFKGAMYMASIRSNTELGRRIREFRRRKRGDLSNGRELPLEIERLRLLRSEDPDERARGEAMETPASLFAAVAEAESQFAVPTTVQDQALGAIPPSAQRSPAAETQPAADGFDVELEPDEAVTDPGRGDDLAEGVADDCGGDQETHPQSQGQNNYSLYSRQYVWLPMEFPDVPQKGDFDVRRLRQSKYFFH